MRSMFNLTNRKVAKDLVWVLQKSKTKVILPSKMNETRKMRLLVFIDDLIEFLED